MNVKNHDGSEILLQMLKQPAPAGFMPAAYRAVAGVARQDPSLRENPGDNGQQGRFPGEI